MLIIDFTTPAAEQLDDILEESEEEFGLPARRRMERLVEQALIDLAENPHRNGTKVFGERIHYQIRHSMTKVQRSRRPRRVKTVGQPRYILVVKVVDRRLAVLAVAYDGMVDELDRRIQEGHGNPMKFFRNDPQVWPKRHAGGRAAQQARFR